MTFSLGQQVCDKTDPRADVGFIEAMGLHKIYVRWHLLYASWLAIEIVRAATEDEIQAQKLRQETWITRTPASLKANT